jgi:hypothetical protein
LKKARKPRYPTFAMAKPLPPPLSSKHENH